MFYLVISLETTEPHVQNFWNCESRPPFHPLRGSSRVFYHSDWELTYGSTWVWGYFPLQLIWKLSLNNVNHWQFYIKCKHIHIHLWNIHLRKDALNWNSDCFISPSPISFSWKNGDSRILYGNTIPRIDFIVWPPSYLHINIWPTSGQGRRNVRNSQDISLDG